MRWAYSTKLLLHAILLILILPISGCGQGYDSTLMNPDIDGHGYTLTPLGCLLFSPLSYIENWKYNVATYYKGKEISSVGVPYSDIQKQIVFEFQRNGSMKYWLKKDYLVPVFDTTINARGEKSTTHYIKHSSQLQLRKIYDSGKWQVNFADSTLTIDFGENDLGLLPLKGKYTRLGAGSMAFRQTTSFDSSTNGKMEPYVRNVNTYFESY